MSYKNKTSKLKKRCRSSAVAVSHAFASIALSHNNVQDNVQVALTDTKGNVLCWSSNGSVGMKNNKKSTPFAALLSLLVKT